MKPTEITTAKEKSLKYFNGNDLAATVWVDKYALSGEETPHDMHVRLAKEIAKYLPKKATVLTPQEFADLSSFGKGRPPLTYEVILELLQGFKKVVPQGSIMSQLGNTASIGSLSNCFVIGQPEDSYGGIFQKDEQAAQLMKRRGGVGIDISSLRPEGVKVSNSAKSSTGAVTFAERYSNTTREVAQGGRRGALMLSIDITHPDSLIFIKVKRNGTRVTGANISVKITDAFMKAVENDQDYLLTFPCELNNSQEITKNLIHVEDLKYDELEQIGLDNDDNKFYVKRVKAKHYWDEVVTSAHKYAEPGIMFIDTHYNLSPDTVYPQFKGITTNPCGEIFMQPFDACRLIANNLTAYVKKAYTEEAYFDMEEFYVANYRAMQIMDIIVDIELDKIKTIINKIESDPESMEAKRVELELWQQVLNTAQASRRTGLGFTGLGDVYAMLGIAYDSNQAKLFTEALAYVKMLSEYECTIDEAIIKGSFKGWDNSKEFYKDEEGNYKGYNDFYQMLLDKYPEQTHIMMKYGRRNLSWSTLAPTGTTSLMTQTTSGIEPLFAPVYWKRNKVADGDTTKRVDFVDDVGDKWMNYPVFHPPFKTWVTKQMESNLSFIGLSPEDLTEEQVQDFYEKSPWFGSIANDINYIDRVEIQGILQSRISHSISSTINLPEDVSEEKVSEIYFESWKRGLKGITVYRDGSRSGVLITKTSKKEDEIVYHDAVKRPQTLPCDVVKITSQGENWMVIVGLMADKPYEVFCVKDTFLSKEVELKGNVIKKDSGHYQLVVDDKLILHNICDKMSEKEGPLTKYISMMLRHGINVKFFIEQTDKADLPISAFQKAIARVLKRYIPSGEVSSNTCDNCKSKDLIYEEGCLKCQNCGEAKCG